MKPFAGYENVQVSDFEKLPKGAYEVKIMDAKEVPLASWKSPLRLQPVNLQDFTAATLMRRLRRTKSGRA